MELGGSAVGHGTAPNSAARERVAMIRQDQLDRLDEIIRRARAAGNTEVAAKAVDLLARALRQMALDEAEAGPPDTCEADPMSRARARAREAGEPADGLHKLRKGRDRCTATRRDGEPCEAPAAVDNALVCRRHGGSAPQVRIAAKHLGLQLALYGANRDFEEARGTPGEFDALCRWSRARRELDEYEVKLRLLAELRAELKRRRAAPGTMRTSP